MQVKKKVQYFHAGLSSFVVKDIEILRKEYLLHDFYFETRNKKKIPFLFLKQLFFLLRHLPKTDIIICQFAGHHSFLPILTAKVFRKKSVVVAGGTDCVSFPSIQYGNFNSRFLAKTTRFSFKHCSLILPVHDTLIEYDYTYQDHDFPKQGYRYFIPDIKTPVYTILNGYDSAKWYHDASEQKEENSFVTVGSGLGSRFGFLLKGIDLIFEIAPFFPQCTFYIVGGAQIGKDSPKNVKLISNIPNHELRPFISRMQFYMQLSMSEGFPNALSEAMLCECIPVVSATGGMPDIVGSNGYILRQKDQNELKQLIEQAIALSNKQALGKKARQKIKTEYTLEKREYELLQAIRKL